MIVLLSWVNLALMPEANFKLDRLLAQGTVLDQFLLYLETSSWTRQDLLFPLHLNGSAVVIGGTRKDH